MNDLLHFIDSSPSPFHAVDSLCQALAGAGYVRLAENAPWHLVPGGKYFVTRNGSALVTFRVPRGISPASSSPPPTATPPPSASRKTRR